MADPRSSESAAADHDAAADLLHTTTNPTLVRRENGARQWHTPEGKLHRVNGPAVEWADGGREWWVDNKRHRADGPAVEEEGGREWWWVDGKRHRDNAPAVELPDGGRAWWVEGYRHCLDGPAVEYTSGRREWWVDGVRVDESEHEAAVLASRRRRGGFTKACRE
jgi:hypothetical protein